MKYRELLICAATADERSALKSDVGRIEFTQGALSRFADDPTPRVPLMIAHGTDVAAYCGYVAAWSMSEDGRSLVALAHQTRDLDVQVGSGASLGVNFLTRLSETSGHKRVTNITKVRELSVGLSTDAALKSSRVLAVGPWVDVPDSEQGEVDLSAQSAARSAWERAGLPWGHSSGVFVPTKAPRVLYSTRSD